MSDGLEGLVGACRRAENVVFYGLAGTVAVGGVALLCTGLLVPAHSKEDRIARVVLILLALACPPAGFLGGLWQWWRGRRLYRLLATPNGVAKVGVVTVRHRGAIRSFGLRFHPVGGGRELGLAVTRRDRLDAMLVALKQRFPAASVPDGP